MRLTRIHVDLPLASGAQVPLPAQAGEHLTRVLRLDPGAALTLFNGRGGEYAATLAPRQGKLVHARVLDHDPVERESTLDLTLLQGVLNTFVIFFARIIGGVIDSFLRARSGEENQSQGGGIAYFVIVMITEMVLAVVASIIVMAFSRYREFRADAGGARLAGATSMVSALMRLRQAGQEPLPGSHAAFGIAGGGTGGLRRLFMSHPPIEERIAALQTAARGTSGPARLRA